MLLLLLLLLFVRTLHHFSKGDRYCDLLFTYMTDVALSKGDILLSE